MQIWMFSGIQLWMQEMKPRPRRSGDQYVHRETERYRQQVRRKLAAYHCHIQLGVIAQGLLQSLAVLNPNFAPICRIPRKTDVFFFAALQSRA